MSITHFAKTISFFCSIILLTDHFSISEISSVDQLIKYIYQENVNKSLNEIKKIESIIPSNKCIEITGALQQITLDNQWIPLIEKLTQKCQENGYFSYLLAKTYFDTGNIESAIRTCQKAVNRFSTDTDLLYRFAVLVYSKGQYEPIESWLNTLLQVNPRHTEGKFLLGCIQARIGKIKEAKELFLQIIEESPHHRLVNYELGLLENQLGNSRAAEEYLRKTIQQQPFLSEAYNALLIALARQEKTHEIDLYRSLGAYLNQWQHSKIERIWKSFRKPNTVSPKEAYELVIELCKVHREDLALTYIDQWKSSGKSTPSLLLLQAQIYYNQHDYSGCMDIIQQFPDSAIQQSELIAILLGWSEYYLQNYEDSRLYYQEGIFYHPHSKDLQALGKALENPNPIQNQVQQKSTETQKKQEDDSQTETVLIKKIASTQQEVDSSLSQNKVSQKHRFQFSDVTEEVGLHTFQHTLGHKDKKWIIDAMGSGVAVGDYDNDGDDDIYFVNGYSFGEENSTKYINTLFQNNNGKFIDKTKESGVGDTGFGMSAIFGDIDNDGWLDLFVGNYGANVLYRNNGDETFTDITQQAGVGDTGYNAAAAFADVDIDGDLDLFVGNYVAFNREKHSHMRDRYFGMSVFTGPLAFPAERDILYINDGSGKFTEAPSQIQPLSDVARAMGAVFFDIDNDNDLDLYVTNDSTFNFVFENTGKGVYEDISLLSGGAFTQSGVEGASMGVCPLDYNNDGFMDLFITSYERQSDRFFESNGKKHLFDITGQLGLASPSYILVTWGCVGSDFDSDGWIDIFTANGHLYPQVEQLGEKKTYPQGVSFYRNIGAKFQDISEEVQFNNYEQKGGRGAALIDYDQDGDMDIIMNCIDDTPQLLENQTPQQNWLQVKLKGNSAQTYGVRVVIQKGNQTWTRIVDGGSGYLSQSTSVLHFGLGKHESVDSITVFWFDKEPTIIKNPKINERIEIPN
jgi:tetratricopeptide (TPR) repeat protein